MIRILQLARSLVTKSKSCRSIFCWIRCEFLKFNTLQPTPSSSTSPSGIYKKYTCFPKVSINSCSTRSWFYFKFVMLDRNFFFGLDSQVISTVIRYFQNTLLSGIFRTSYYCSFVLLDHQNILLPEIDAPCSGHLTTRNVCSLR